MDLYSQFYPVYSIVRNSPLHCKISYPSNIIMNSCILAFGTYFAYIKVPDQPFMDQMECFCHQTCLNILFLHNGQVFFCMGGRIFRLQQVFLVLSGPPPLRASAKINYCRDPKRPAHGSIKIGMR